MTLKPLSDQIREAITASGTSRYVLARSAKVSEAAISRFMAGESGLTLATLDRLGAVLGLQIVVTVQSVPRRAPKGRKPKGKQSVPQAKAKDAATNREHTQKLAYAMARDAFENHFPSRRGIWELEDVGLLCVYNNNPYRAGVEPDREWETARFREALKREGLEEVGYATYPPAGQEDAGYTYAMLIKAGPDRMNWIVNTLVEITQRGAASRSATLRPDDMTPEFLAFTGGDGSIPETAQKTRQKRK